MTSVSCSGDSSMLASQFALVPFPNFTHLFLASTVRFLRLLHILLSLAVSQVELVAVPGPPPVSAVDTVEPEVPGDRANTATTISSSLL